MAEEPCVAGTIFTIAGTGVSGYNGDGIAAVTAQLRESNRVIADEDGNIFISDTDQRRVRLVDASTGLISTIAGTGSTSYNGDGIVASAANVAPLGIALDSNNGLLVADLENARIRRVDLSTMLISTVAGTGVPGYSGDGGPATAAQLRRPFGLFAADDGSFYFTDTQDYRVRKVDPQGTITTVAGTGVQGFNGDDIPAVTAMVGAPTDVAVDMSGNIYIADNRNYRVRRIDATTGVISTVVGNGVQGYNGDGISATAASLHDPLGIALAPDGDLFIADHLNHRIRRVSGGVIETVAGTGVSGYNGDEIAATSAHLHNPHGVFVDIDGNLLIAGSNSRRVRFVNACAPTPPDCPGPATFSVEGFGPADHGTRFGTDLPIEYGAFSWGYDDPVKQQAWGSWTIVDSTVEASGAEGSDNWLKARAADVGKGAKITNQDGFLFDSMKLFTDYDRPAFIDRVAVTYRTIDNITSLGEIIELEDDQWITVTSGALGIDGVVLKAIWFNAIGIAEPNAAKFGLDDFEFRCPGS